MTFSNTSYGDFQRFEDSDYAYKEKFLRVNVDSHVMIADYFIKMFLKRKDKSGLVFTASAASYLPMAYLDMYHSAKTMLSALSCSLYAEYRNQNIDIAVVHPTAVSETKFYSHEGI